MTYRRKQGYRLKITERHRVVKHILGNTLIDMGRAFEVLAEVVRACGLSLRSVRKKEENNASR